MRASSARSTFVSLVVHSSIEPHGSERGQQMKIGLQVPSFTWPGGAEGIRPKLAEIARQPKKPGSTACG